jgi:chorismate synthase
MALRYVISGESHGPQATAVILGLPVGLAILEEDINRDLARRQQGYGRGDRQKIERDVGLIKSGVRFGRTLGSPLTIVIENRDWPNWTDVMSVAPREETGARAITRPRPGHADLAGVLKWRHADSRNVLERASARNTTALVATGAVAKRLLAEFNIAVFAHVVMIGGIGVDVSGKSLSEIREAAEASAVRVADPARETEIIAAIDRAKEAGDTLGGVFEVIVTGVPVGLGTCLEIPLRLDGRLGQALMSIPAIKGCEIGIGFEAARRPGSRVHDPIYFDREHPERYREGHGPTGGFYRTTNNAGGLEGGITNGEPIVCRAVMKPIPTLCQPLPSVDFETKEPFQAQHERSDVCAVPAASVVAEAAVAFVIAEVFLEKFGGDTMDDVRAAYDGYLQYLNSR